MEAYPFRLLSHCLYHCADKHEFNRYFSEYYECISKLLMRRIKQRLSTCGYRGDLNAVTADLCRDIFDEYYQSIFTNLPKSAERIQELAGSLKLTSRGELFSRQVLDWEQQIVDWTRVVMNFLNHPVTESDVNLGLQAREINHLRPALRDQGYGLLTWLLPNSQAHTENESAGDDVSPDIDDDSDVVDNGSMEDIDSNGAHSRYHNAFKQRVAELNEIMCTEGETVADTVAGCEGGARFGVNTFEILDHLSKTLIPVIPTLYWLANNRVTDYLRRTAKDPIHNQFEQSASTDLGDDTDESLVDRMGDESKERAELDLWNDVRALLRQPAVEAGAELQQPGLTDKQRQRAQAKLQRCEHHYNLNLAVLELILEGHSEEAIGSHLGFTRDQVRGRKKEIRQLLESLRDSRH